MRRASTIVSKPTATSAGSTSCLMSPDGKVRAQYKDRNLWIMNPDGSNPLATPVFSG